MILRRYSQIILDKILSLFPYNINYSLSFKDESFTNLLNNDFNFVTDNEKKSTILLIQGPIINFKYLFVSIKFYLCTNSYKRIVISTWENDLLPSQKNDLMSLGILDILENTKPIYCGISNINFQIISTQNGLKYIHSNFPNSYVLKSRTDQRILNVSCNSFLKTLISNFKLSNSVLKNRIIISNFNTYKFRIYSISDMFMFGETLDLLLYWNVPLDERTFSLKDIQNPRTMNSWSRLNLAEVYLSTNFFKKIGYNHNWTINDYWNILNEFFIVVDSETIGLEWNKYTFNNKKGTLNQYNLRERFYNFSDWIIYQNKNLQFDFNLVEKKINFYENIKIQKN